MANSQSIATLLGRYLFFWYGLCEVLGVTKTLKIVL